MEQSIELMRKRHAYFTTLIAEHSIQTAREFYDNMHEQFAMFGVDLFLDESESECHINITCEDYDYESYTVADSTNTSFARIKTIVEWKNPTYGCHEEVDIFHEPRYYKHEIETLEKEIIKIVETDKEWTDDTEQRYIVENLLKQRCDLLNKMFVPNAENLKRFRRVNDHLLKLTDSADHRLGEINAVEYYMASHDDDDEVIESWVRFVYNDEKSILRLEDDDYYGSNFALMIKTLYELYWAKRQEKIVHLRNGHPRLDDGKSWMDAPFVKWRDGFKDIIICYAVHDLTNHKAYSVPDLLRLNNFWMESSITFQSFTRQDDSHFNTQIIE